MGGPSGPTLLSRIAATRKESVGPEGPPTVAKPTLRARRKAYHSLPHSWNRTR
ncbi:DUF6053 domain-containing protein [Lysobacter enzymogenes]|uniref:DUF6053 domain-containing protein n=1 Tax=Lysobacter enzymogenes TaxID=69 RepID=UPI003D1897EA